MGLDINSFPPMEVACPCGLLAKYFPKDQFVQLIKKEVVANQGLQSPENTENFAISLDEVADEFFKRGFQKAQSNSAAKQWIDVTNAQFINWMVE